MNLLEYNDGGIRVVATIPKEATIISRVVI